MTALDVSLLPWGLNGAGDFADAAWCAAEILGNRHGVVRLSVKLSPYADRPHVALVLDSATAMHAYVGELGPEETRDIHRHEDGSMTWSGLVHGIDLFLFTDAAQADAEVL